MNKTNDSVQLFVVGYQKNKCYLAGCFTNKIPKVNKRMHEFSLMKNLT